MEFIDQMNRKVEIPSTPKKIISLVPSQTELLFDLGLKDEIVGVTRYCIHPKEFYRKKTFIGGTKNIDLSKIRELAPDIIIGNKEENEKSQIEQLEKEFPVWMSDIETLENALQMISLLGKITDREVRSELIRDEILKGFSNVPQFSGTVGYFIWKNPYMIAGKGTFIDNMLDQLGLTNIAKMHRYPIIEPEQLKELRADYIFLSSEPYPFKEKHIQELKQFCPESTICIVDGEMFSWYGSRLKYAPSYFLKLFDQIGS